MPDTSKKVVAFQCPQCGCALELTVGQIKSPEPTHCSGCGVAISTDTKVSSSVADDIREATEKSPPEITIKFIDRAGDEDDGA
jgi:predicted RNA-binding Zn-ribbon protein involved in translation (DUF1610 family)